MDTALLSKTAAAMVAKGKGILAADESSGTCETRFKSINVECTEENRRAYRGLLFTTPGIEQYLSGVILFDETLRQKTNDGVPFGDYLAKKGIIPGIKVDAGAKELPLAPGEKVTEGLDGLPKRLGINHWALAGDWTIGAEKVVLDQAGGSIRFRFHARDAHLVLSPGAREPISFRVLLDGEAPGQSHGVDVDQDGNGVLPDGRMYQLVRQHDAIRDRTLEIAFLAPGAEAYAFTFG